MKQILVIGSGNFGTALSQVLAANCKVSLLTRRQEIYDSIRNVGENQLYFPGIKLHKNISVIQNYPCFDDYQYIIFAIPSSSILSEFKAIEHQLSGQMVINTAKGFTESGQTFLTAIKKRYTRCISLLGPTFASDLIRGGYSGLTVACESESEYLGVVDLFSKTAIKLDYSLNYKLIETASVTKNVFAIAMGIFDALDRIGVNTKFLILTQCLKETRLILDLFNPTTKDYVLYATIGDMLLTSLNDQSRNRTFGMLIGKGFYDHKVQHSAVLLEGARSVKFIHTLCIENQLDCPIVSFVIRVLEGDTVYAAYQKCIDSF